jgi:hypothetical protein
MLAEKRETTIRRLTAVKCNPCISIMMPFEPKMNSKAAIMHSLKKAADKIRHDLNERYQDEIAESVFKRLKDVIARLDFNTHKKTVAIYVSPEIEKVCYVNIELKEKVVVDSAFEIRDIVRNKIDEPKFLVLTISGKMERLYEATCNKMQLILSNKIEQIKRDLPEPVSNFTDANSVKETTLKKFLHYIDLQLSNVLSIYPLPLFLMAPKKTAGYFQQLAKHGKNITGFIHGDFDDATESELLKALEPQLSNWKEIKEKHIMNRLKLAADEGQLIKGINDVWIQVSRKHKQFLVVEKDFYCGAFITQTGEVIFSEEFQRNKPVVRDAVDNIIEKVLEGGGDVEFVDELKDFSKIALIKRHDVNYNYDTSFKKERNHHFGDDIEPFLGLDS